jgi:hypothetical protein
MGMYHVAEALRRTMRLMLDLEAFNQEHRRCGRPLDGGVDDDSVWISCSCGAMISRDTTAAWSAAP